MRVLHIVGGLDAGGIEYWLKGYFEYLKKDVDIKMNVFSCNNMQTSLMDGLTFNKDNVIAPKGSSLFSVINTYIKELKSERYDVIQCHTDLSTSYFFILAKLFSNAKLVAHSHTDRRKLEENLPFYRKCYRKFARYIIAKISDVNVAVSKAAGESLYINDYVVEYCGVSVIKQSVAESILKLDNKKIIFHVGRMSKPKNHVFALDLANKFQNMPDYHFVFIGGGEDENKVLNYKDELKLNNVSFLGHRNDVHALLQGHNGVVILPSLWEGLPLVLVEAQKCGRYCVASDFVTKEANIGGVEYLPLELSLWKEKLLALDFYATFEIENSNVFSYESNYNFFMDHYK